MSKETDEFHAIVIEKMFSDPQQAIIMVIEGKVIEYWCFHCKATTIHEVMSDGRFRCIYKYRHKEKNNA